MIDSPFNTQPLLEEIDSVIKRGLTSVFKDFIIRYEKLENMHNQIIGILSINNEVSSEHCFVNSEQCINLNSEIDDESKWEISIKEDEADKTIYNGIQDMAKEIVSETLSNIEKKIEMLENKYKNTIMLFWTLQITILSIIFISLVHHLFNYLKDTLTVPKIKDLVNAPTKKYDSMYKIIDKSDNTTAYSFSLDSTPIDLLGEKLLPQEDNKTSMKDELKNFLKKQLRT